jgi:type II secretory ATPase GspE/PulE/Tfp pilus assembly ATPase PilB-like protein
MDLAGSGVNLYTTTHAASAQMIPERLASDFIGVPRDFLAAPGVLKLLVYQALLPRLCPHCALPLASLYRGAAGAHWQAWAARFGRLYCLDLRLVRIRNPQGCAQCGNADLPHLNGTQGRTVVAEMIEPAHDEDFLECVRARDHLRMRRHLRARAVTAACDADMRGKSAMDCAVYKAAAGLIDPRDIEPRFRAFETVEAERAALDGRA